MTQVQCKFVSEVVVVDGARGGGGGRREGRRVEGVGQDRLLSLI